jgi:hypothetical protein
MSVRDRLDAAQRAAEPPEPLKADPAKARSNLVSGNLPTASTRERAGINLAPEKLSPNKAALRFAGLATAVTEYPGSVRERLNRAADIERAKTVAPELQSASDYYFAIYKREEAQKKADQAEAERRNQEKIAKHQQQEAEERRLASPEVKTQQWLMSLMWGDICATPAEIAEVTALVKKNKPSQIGNPEAYKWLLLELRTLREAARGNIKPNWAR